jgi:hypothetical protein
MDPTTIKQTSWLTHPTKINSPSPSFSLLIFYFVMIMHSHTHNQNTCTFFSVFLLYPSIVLGITISTCRSYKLC